MRLSEYIIMFVLVLTWEPGCPARAMPHCSRPARWPEKAGLTVWVVLATAMAAWMLGSAAGYAMGARRGRSLLERPGWLERSRQSLLAKGDRLCGRHAFLATVTMPAFVSGIFRIRFALFMMGALAAGAFWIGAYVVVSYFLGAKIARSIGDAGSMTILGVVVIVAAGLIIRAGLAKWRSTRPAHP